MRSMHRGCLRNDRVRSLSRSAGEGRGEGRSTGAGTLNIVMCETEASGKREYNSDVILSATQIYRSMPNTQRSFSTHSGLSPLVVRVDLLAYERDFRAY
jgi:hypothetical protein